MLVKMTTNWTEDWGVPGLDIAITWITEIVADEIIIPIVGAGAINIGRSLYKRFRRQPKDPNSALDAAEAQLQDDLVQPGVTVPPVAQVVDRNLPPMAPPDSAALVAIEADRASPYSAARLALAPDSAALLGSNLSPQLLTTALAQLEYRRIRGELLLKRVQISRLQQDRVTWLIWSVGFGWSVYAALTPFELENFTNPKLGLLLFLGANFVMGLVRIAVDASLLKSLQVELEASQHQLDHFLPEVFDRS